MFRFETIGRMSSSAMVFAAVACLAVALPAALLSQKSERRAVEAYLEFEVRPMPARILADRHEEALRGRD